jgi:protoheme IX farnesyltransferase
VSTERVATLAASSARGRRFGAGFLADYWALTKPDVNLLILITTAAGFCLAPSTHFVGFPVLLLIRTLLGTLLIAGGTAALNQYAERRFDAQMRRTKRRPLAAGRINPSRALWFGVALSVCGAVCLAGTVNLTAGLLAVLTLLSYLLIYTPLKRKTPLCVLVGAFPGAAPPLIGWAAASGTLSHEAWLLYAIVFLWQFPHFMAIAWMYREDYQRAGYQILPEGTGKTSLMTWQIILPSAGLLVLSFAPALPAKGGLFYQAGALLLSICFLYYGAQLAVRKTNVAARRLLLASIVYLPVVFLWMVLGRL